MSVEEHDLCVKGLDVLMTALGNVEAERFIMLMNRDAGDYTQWRRDNLYANMDLEGVAKHAREIGAKIRALRPDFANRRNKQFA